MLRHLSSECLRSGVSAPASQSLGEGWREGGLPSEALAKEGLTYARIGWKNLCLYCAIFVKRGPRIIAGATILGISGR
jgi:hypothetical protein